MYYNTFLCPEEEVIKLYQFLHNLVFTQTPRSIIQATVNTIHSGKVKSSMNKKLNEFFLALYNIFHFQLGNILLAIKTSDEIKDMLDKDWPYFSHHREKIEQCLNGHNCQGVTDIVNSLGKTHSFANTYITTRNSGHYVHFILAPVEGWWPLTT